MRSGVSRYRAETPYNKIKQMSQGMTNHGRLNR